MYYCRKCGFALQDGEVFCPQCGEQKSETIVKDEPLSQSSAESGAASPQTVEESIELADKLSSKYFALTQIKDEIADCEARIKRSNSIPPARRHSAFKFFWPFLIIASASCTVVTLIGAFIAVAANSEDIVILAEVLGVIAAAIVLIAGGNRARNKRDALNSQVADEEYRLRKSRNELEKNLEDLKRRRTGLTKAVQDYNYLVPSSARTKAKMDMVKDLLSSGRAQNFRQAVELVSMIGK